MYLANQRQVTFKELAGLSFVVLNDIGSWKTIIQENIPDAKFLYQTEYDALSELTNIPVSPSLLLMSHNQTIHMTQLILLHYQLLIVQQQ